MEAVLQAMTPGLEPLNLYLKTGRGEVFDS